VLEWLGPCAIPDLVPNNRNFWFFPEETIEASGSFQKNWFTVLFIKEARAQNLSEEMYTPIQRNAHTHADLVSHTHTCEYELVVVHFPPGRATSRVVMSGPLFYCA